MTFFSSIVWGFGPYMFFSYKPARGGRERGEARGGRRDKGNIYVYVCVCVCVCVCIWLSCDERELKVANLNYGLF